MIGGSKGTAAGDFIAMMRQRLMQFVLYTPLRIVASARPPRQG